MLWLHIGMYSMHVLIATASEVGLQLIHIDHTVGGDSKVIFKILGFIGKTINRILLYDIV